VERKVAVDTFKTKIEHWAPPKNYTSSSEASNRAVMITLHVISNTALLLGLYDLKPFAAIPLCSVQAISKHFSKHRLKHNIKIQLVKEVRQGINKNQE
jgi:hypothetical protein